MFSNKRKANITIPSNLSLPDSRKSRESNCVSMPSLVESTEAISNVEMMDTESSTGSSISSYGQSPCSVTKRKKFKWFSGDSNSNPMETTSTTSSSIELVKYSSQPFDDFKKPHDIFGPTSECSDQGNKI